MGTAREASGGDGRGASALEGISESDPEALAQRLRASGLPLVLPPTVRARGLVRRAAGPLACALLLLVGVALVERANDVIDGLIATTDEAQVEQTLNGVADGVWVGFTVGLACMLAAPVAGWLADRAARRLPAPAGNALGVILALGASSARRRRPGIRALCGRGSAW